MAKSVSVITVDEAGQARPASEDKACKIPSIADIAKSVAPYSAVVNTRLFCIMLANEAALYRLAHVSGRSLEFVKSELGAFPGTVHELADFYKQFWIFPGEVT